MQPENKAAADRDIEFVKDMIAAISEEKAKCALMVQAAYNEGFNQGMNEVNRPSGGKTWYESRSKEKLDNQ